MILSSELSFLRRQHNCVVKSISSSDVTSEYVSSLRSNSQILKYADKSCDMQSQATYIDEIRANPRSCIVGLFIDGKLIGTCGIQEIISEDLSSVGVFLFESVPRGQGWGYTLLWACCELVRQESKTWRFIASTRLENDAARGLFKHAGFSELVSNEVIMWVGCLASSIRKPNDLGPHRVGLVDSYSR